MAIERFIWETEKGAEGDITQRVRTKQFAGGYEQSVEDGLNNQSQSWPLTFTGAKPRMLAIKAFLDKHKGAKAFLWTPPLGDLGLYKCNGYKPVHRGGQVYAINVTFQQTFHP